MRLHITLEDEVVHELDRRVGPRRRSGFIAAAVRMALDDERRWDPVESSLGTVPSEEHEWDDDPAAWVQRQRRMDTARVG
jgi:hypothetical protein